VEQLVEPVWPGAVGHYDDPDAADRVETHDVPESNARAEVLDMSSPSP